MGKVIGFFSLKGGVGKTTISSSLAFELANWCGKKVLLIDSNYSAPNIGIHMGMENYSSTIQDVLFGQKFSPSIYKQHGVDVIPGDFLYDRAVSPLKLRSKLQGIKNHYDYVILDSSPSFNDELLSAFYSSDEMFLVTTPDYATLSCSIKLARYAKSRDVKIGGVIVNRISDPKNEITLNEIQESTGLPVVLTVQEDGYVKKALHERMPAPAIHRRSGFAKEIRKLASAVSGYEEQRPLWKKFLFLDFDGTEVNRQVLREHFYTSIFKENNDKPEST